MKQRISFLVSAIGVGLVLGMMIFLIETNSSQEVNVTQTAVQGQVVNEKNLAAEQVQAQIEVEGSVVWLPIDQMIDLSDAIFVGKVLSVSPTRWNQDNGEPWVRDSSDSADYTPLEIHSLEVEVIQRLVDVVRLDKRATITVATPNPQDEGADYLTEGDQVLLFALQTKISWRGRLEEVLRITNYFPYGYFTLGDDNLYHGFSVEDSEPIALSLEQWINRISDRRTQTTP